ncbi:MAG: hypothetical protein FWC03_03715 [Treponema sp.]|nr:hypothetical protein [Treponema sp.]
MFAELNQLNHFSTLNQVGYRILYGPIALARQGQSYLFRNRDGSLAGLMFLLEITL